MSGEPLTENSTGQSTSARLVGEPVTKFLTELCREYAHVSHLRFATYTRESGLTERLKELLLPEEGELRDKALEICNRGGISFWNALLSMCLKRGKVPRRFLESAGAHDLHSRDSSFEVRRDRISPEAFAQIVSGLPDGAGLVVSSRVILSTGGTAHIPMLDFLCPCSDGNRRAVRDVIALLDQTTGVIAESGRSYHFYGGDLLSREEWIKFMAKALLFAPVTDPRYIAHRLADGECRLRIAASKEAPIPLIVDEIAKTT